MARKKVVKEQKPYKKGELVIVTIGSKKYVCIVDGEPTSRTYSSTSPVNWTIPIRQILDMHNDVVKGAPFQRLSYSFNTEHLEDYILKKQIELNKLSSIFETYYAELNS